MENVEHVVKHTILLLGDPSEYLQQGALGEGVWLSQNDVVPIWEALKRIAEEVNTTTLIQVINTVQID